MEIRKADINDFNFVNNITSITIKAIYPHYYPKGAVDFFLSHHSPENIKNDINSGNVYLLSSENNTIGTITVKGNHINRLFILPDFQKKGGGRILMDFAEKLISKHYKEILTDASLPAKGMYLKRGYTEAGYNKILTENSDYLCYDEMKKIIE